MRVARGRALTSADSDAGIMLDSADLASALSLPVLNIRLTSPAFLLNRSLVLLRAGVGYRTSRNYFDGAAAGNSFEPSQGAG